MNCNWHFTSSQYTVVRANGYITTYSKVPNKRFISNQRVLKGLSDLTHARLQIRQSTIYYVGLLGRWDKWIVDQESDVPSIIFLYFL